MRIDLKLVFGRYDFLAGHMMLWGEPSEGMPGLGMYHMDSAVVAVNPIDGQRVQGQVMLRLRRRADGTVIEGTSLALSKTFTDQEVAAGEAEINVDDYKEVLLRVIDAQGAPVP